VEEDGERIALAFLVTEPEEGVEVIYVADIEAPCEEWVN
jgi:hypothetical protein